MDEEPIIIESYSKEQIDELIAASTEDHYGLPVLAVTDAEGYEQTIAVARTKEERLEANKKSCEETLWAFVPAFIAKQTGIKEEVFSTLQTLCENANEAVRAIVDSTCGFETLVKAAAEVDGYGHNIATYDNREVELDCGYYAYRLD